jgi:phasin family protein
MNMQNVQDQLSEMNKGNVETTLRFAKIYMSSAEKLLKLQLDAAKAALEENARNARALMEVKDPQQAVSVRTKLAEASMESAMSFSRNVYEVASQTQQEITALLEERLSDFNKSMAGGVDKAAKNAPPGADVAVAALKSTVAATTAAVDSMTKAAKQVAEFAEASMRAATSASAEAMKGATRGTKK